MPHHDTFTKDFDKLLAIIPDDFTLAQWQFAYRSVVYSMGMKILERFPEAVIGSRPHVQPAPHVEMMTTGGAQIPAAAGGPGGGGHPHTICTLVCLVVSL
jgi:hypothetical protein